MTPIEALQNAIQECVEVDSHGELSFKAGDVSNFIKESGFKLVSTVPSEVDVERVTVAITDEFICFSKKYWLRMARAAIAAYVGGE